METEETLPFPPPFARPTSADRAAFASMMKGSSAPSLEQLTEARLAELRNEGFFSETPPPRSSQRHSSQPHSSQPHSSQPHSSQMVLASEKTDRQIVLARYRTARAPLVPLRWRGMPVSEELQVYALRVARGEDLAPYRGPILADVNHELPWDAADTRELRKGTRRSTRLLAALAALGALAAFVLPNLETSLPERTELAPVVPELALSAAPAAAPLEPAPFVGDPLPALQEPLPALREPLAPARRSAAARSAALASNAPRTSPAPSPASSATQGATPASSATQVATPATSAPKRQAEARAHDAPPAAQHAAATPSPDATGPSMLLVDKPTF